MILLLDRVQVLVSPPAADGSCNDSGDESHGIDPTQIAPAIVRFHTRAVRAICTVFKTRWLTRASDQRPRLVSVAQCCRMTVGRHRRLTVVELGCRSDAIFPLILKHYDCLSRVAVARMLDRLGRAAAAHHMYLVCSSDTAEEDATYRNTVFFLGRDGREIGRYYKVQPTIAESDRVRGISFPVFETPDLGGVGMLIRYDMVMPESSRSLALNRADVIFLSTMGGAVTTGDESLNRAAFRTRAADNYVYFVIAMRNGAMIISPQGTMLAEATQPGGIAMADSDPFGGREGGDALNTQRDMRARLFRERNPPPTVSSPTRILRC
jgi:predicted amidohydrolase